MREQVLDIEHTPDVVYISLIHWDAAVVVLHHTVEHRIEIVLDIQVDNILPWSHDFLCRLITKPDDALQHALLVLDLLLIGEFECLLQVVDAEHMVFLLHDFPGEGATAHQDGLQRPEEVPEHHQSAHGEAAILQRVLPPIHLWHDFAKEQQEEREDDGDAKELEPCCVAKVYGTFEDKIAQHDDGDVDQVVGDQDGSERALTILPKNLNTLVGSVVLWVEGIEVGGRKIEECYL